MEIKLGNPAVVGLAGFGLTTLMLQMHNLGVVGVAPVIWLGIVFGGGCQLIAGLMEFKTGNNFGFMAFTGYGAFWISLALLLVFGTNTALGKAFPVLAMGPSDLGYYLLAWAIFTAILFVGSMRHNTALAVVFLTLLLGLLGLGVGALAAMPMLGTLAAWDLIVCAFSALYLGASTALADSGVKIPVGPAWMS